MTLMLAGCESLYSVSASVGSGLASAASWAPTFLGPYRPDVHQGNIISKEMVDQLRIGMTRDQVRFMLGTPLMSSEFRKDRVDYVYYLNPLKGPVQNRRLTLFFKDNRLERFETDPMPTEDDSRCADPGPEREAGRTHIASAGDPDAGGLDAGTGHWHELTRTLNGRPQMPMKIAIAGASGRMGQMLIESVLGNAGLRSRGRARSCRQPGARARLRRTVGAIDRCPRERRSDRHGWCRRADRLHPARGDAAPPRSLRRTAA